jgi:uncharacterized damage-inducible protein DinB
MDPRLRPLVAILEVNTRLFRNCLRDVDDQRALTRIDERTNHLSFLACHLVGARAYLTGALGGDGSDPFAALTGDARTIDEVPRFPAVDELLEAWATVTARLMDRVTRLGPVDLEARAPASFPIDDPTVLGMLAFLVQHDAYHVGQMALLRKHLGLGAMEYGGTEER